MPPRGNWGALLSEEPEWKVRRARRRRMVLVALPVAAMAVMVVFQGGKGLWKLWILVFGFLTLLLALRALLYRGLRVYKAGIEYSSMLTSMFGTWDRWLIVSDQPTGLRLRKVHGIEAATGLIDTSSSSYEKFVDYDGDMPNFMETRRYIVQAIREVNAYMGQQSEYHREYYVPLQKR